MLSLHTTRRALARVGRSIPPPRIPATLMRASSSTTRASWIVDCYATSCADSSTSLYSADAVAAGLDALAHHHADLRRKSGAGDWTTNDRWRLSSSASLETAVGEFRVVGVVGAIMVIPPSSPVCKPHRTLGLRRQATRNDLCRSESSCRDVEQASGRWGEQKAVVIPALSICLARWYFCFSCLVLQIVATSTSSWSYGGERKVNVYVVASWKNSSFVFRTPCGARDWHNIWGPLPRSIIKSY